VSFWLLFPIAFLLLAASARLRDRSWRRVGQGASVLLALAGVLLLARRPGTAFPLPGSRPRPWYQP
jgi:NhaP-type Na+/H+ or K+/H+ antiporter